jgi:adenosine/AMP kinase
VVEIVDVPLRYTEGCNIIVGQSHFIKTVEDIAEIVQTSVPGMHYGLAFSEASGPCLVRTHGNDSELVKDAAECALAVGAGHTFYLVIRDGYPINVLNQIKACQEVACVYAATANPLRVLVARTEQGGGIVGVVDGYAPKGVETESDKRDRAALLRRFGYKF